MKKQKPKDSVTPSHSRPQNIGSCCGTEERTGARPRTRDASCSMSSKCGRTMDPSAVQAQKSSPRETFSHTLTVSRSSAVAHASSQAETSCAGRCLCSCHCPTASTSSGDGVPLSPSSPHKLHGFIGTLKKKFSQMMKRDLREPPSSDQHRARSTDAACNTRSVSRSRTLPRKTSSGMVSSGPTTPAGVTDHTFDSFEHCRSRSLRRHRTKTLETTSPVSAVGGPLSPSHFRRIVSKPVHTETVDHSLPEEIVPRNSRSANAIKLHSCNGDKTVDAAQSVPPDTGYGHTSAPVALDPDEDGEEAAASHPGGVLPYYDRVKESSAANSGWCLTRELFKLPKYGWYWGPIPRSEAEERLAGQPDGAFLLRDSSDDRYLLSLSFRSDGRTLHTRIEHCNGLFSFYAQPESEGYSSVVDLIERSMSDSQSGVFCYSRARTSGSPSFPVRLAKPVSRFTQVRTLQYLCRFVIRQHTRVDYIQKLPLPTTIKGWLEETQY